MTVPVVLASASPRRLDLLRRLGIEPTVRPPDVDETPRPDEPPVDLAARLARAKVAVEADDDALVVAADTVVAVGPEALGKPTDREDARAMLALLSGRDHEVLTGVAVRRHGRVRADVATTRVRFRSLRPTEIDWYVATGEPRDKAGGYGLQGAGAALVAGIEGSHTNVIGMPLELLVALARALDVDLLRLGGDHRARRTSEWSSPEEHVPSPPNT